MNGYVQEDSGSGISLGLGQTKTHRERAVDCPDDESSLAKFPHSNTQMERIQHYQEELRKRREEDGRTKHNIDPSASLRLKKLSQNPKVGIDNPTFDGKEKASATDDTISQAGELKRIGGGRRVTKKRKTSHKSQLENNGVTTMTIDGGCAVEEGCVFLLLSTLGTCLCLDPQSELKNLF